MSDKVKVVVYRGPDGLSAACGVRGCGHRTAQVKLDNLKRAMRLHLRTAHGIRTEPTWDAR